MKFQNPSLNSVLKGRKDERTNAQAETNMLPTLSKLGAQRTLQSPNLQREIIRKK